MEEIKRFDQIFGDDALIASLNQALNLDEPEVGQGPFQDSRDIPTILQTVLQVQTDTITKIIQFLTLMNTDTAKQISFVDPARETTYVNQQRFLKAMAERNLLLSKYAQRACQSKISKAKGYGEVDSTTLLFKPPDLAGNTTENISDSSLKLIPIYTGDLVDKDSKVLETFLRAVYDVARTSKLTQNCTKNILLRKCASTASILLEQYIDQLNKPIEDVPLVQLVSKLETKFAVHNMPSKASAQLSKVSQADLTYAQLEAKIRRLAFLASIQEPELSWV